MSLVKNASDSNGDYIRMFKGANGFQVSGCLSGQRVKTHHQTIQDAENKFKSLWGSLEG